MERPEITELRVHGVGGTTPERLMDVPHTELVAGSEEAGFFRPASWIPQLGAADNLEAYSWGGITSRARSRALWIFLLPFAMLNVAGWMFPGASGGGWKRFVSVASIRLAALLNTAVFAAMFAHLTIDIIGFRCTTTEDCTGTWFLGPWRWWADTAQEGIALGIGALALIMLGVAAIARSARAPTMTKPVGDPARRVTLADAELWNRGDVAHHLGVVHTAVALALASLFGIEAAARLDDASSVPDTLLVVGAVQLFVLALSVDLIIGFGHKAGLLKVMRWVALALAAGGLAVTIVMVFIADSPTAVMADGVLIATTSSVIFIMVVALFLLFWGWYLARLVGGWIGRVLGRAPSDAHQAMTSFTLPRDPGHGEHVDRGSFVRRLRQATTMLWVNDNPPVMSMQSAVPFFGAGVVVTVGASVLLRMQSLLGTDFPDAVLNQVAVFGCGWVIVMLVVGIAGWFSAPGRTADVIAHDYDNSPTTTASPVDEASDGPWLEKISSAESAAFITDRAETLLTIPAIIVMVAILIMNVIGGTEVMDVLGAPASLALSFVPVGLIAAFNSLYRSRSFRRTLGIVWDVSTFWPRWFHPWAPPSYGVQAVEQLTRRLAVLTEPNERGERGGVILSAHSQGTVLATAAVSQLDPASQARVAMLTHGSPLNRLYARYFGEFFSRTAFRRLAHDLTPDAPVTWQNLYRRTDPIGGPIFGECSADVLDITDATMQARSHDRLLLDPHDPNPLMRGDARPVSLNHSNYYADPVYNDTIAAMVAALRTTEPATDRS